MFKKVVTKLTGRMPNPFASVHPMPPGFVILFGVESGDQLPHTDTSTAPHILPPSDASKIFARLCSPCALRRVFATCFHFANFARFSHVFECCNYVCSSAITIYV